MDLVDDIQWEFSCWALPLSRTMTEPPVKRKKDDPVQEIGETRDMIFKDYLRVPEDSVKMMMTPPMPALDPSELPSHFELFPEEEPHPEDLLPHDLDAPAGMVSVNDGTYIDVQDSEGLLQREGTEFGYQVTRRKIIKNKNAPTFVIDFYQK